RSAVADLGGERIRGPVLAVDGDDISVTGQHDSAGGGAVGGRDGGEQIRFGALEVRDPLRADARRLEAGFDMVDEREVRIPARGGEGDEAGVLGEGGLCGLGRHDCSCWSAFCGDGPVAWSAGSAVDGAVDDGGDQTTSLYCPGSGRMCTGPLCETAAVVTTGGRMAQHCGLCPVPAMPTRRLTAWLSIGGQYG